MLCFTSIQNKQKNIMNIKFLIFAISIFIISACDSKNNKVGSANKKEVIIDNYHPCSFPLASNFVASSTIEEYYTPLYMHKYLNNIIVESKQCACYQKLTTGFNIEYKWNNGINPKIKIVMNPKIYIGDCSKMKGYYYFKDHYFICYGDIDKFHLLIKRRIRVITILPNDIKYFIDDYTPYSSWMFHYINGNITLYSKDECSKEY